MATRGKNPSDGGGGRGRQGGSHGPGPTAATAQTQTGTSDIDVVLRMRTGSAAAFETFVERFHPVLLDYARRAGVPRGKRDDLASDVLTDVALELLVPGRPTPRNPRVYLIVAFRNRLFNHDRGYARWDRHLTSLVRDAALDFEYADEREVVGGLSEHAVRESRSPEWECAPLQPALEHLAAHLDEALRVEERWLLIAVGENIPQREVAAWLGISHAAARKKLERLRGRLTSVAMRYTNTLEADDGRVVQQFFRRCRARIGASARLPEDARDDDSRGYVEQDVSDTTGANDDESR